jgi:predicted Rossmann fold flavoprotein|tara:strand:- start:76 stop:1284 length:1209 start_codon:yes stop_codon:yes gene_type:complete
LKVAIIGGGAAGFFAAISAKEHHKDAQVTIYEKSTKLLSKVRVSGGGRCNVTHACFEIHELLKFYPRGNRFLKKAFPKFNTTHTVKWFEERGVELKTEKDNRMFPVSDSSQSIVDCLTKETQKLGVEIKLQSTIKELSVLPEGIELDFGTGNSLIVDKLIVASGGSPKLEGFNWLQELGHSIETPVPSLFTFNMPNEPIKELMGAVAENAKVRIQGTKLVANGPLLITHWGTSGPAILKLSAFGARLLAERNYDFKIQVNWINASTEEEYRPIFLSNLAENRKMKIGNLKVEGIPKRLWAFFLDKLEISSDLVCLDLSKKKINRIINTLLNDEYSVKGKTTFKEEFVTCGGVSLGEINPFTMQSMVVPNLYFAGEVMDVDGVTGGFNFQNAWTSGFIAGKLL